MQKLNRIHRRVVAALATGIAGVALAGTADAVDLRDWGRKFAVNERFVVLAPFNNEAVLDKETQLVWRRSPVQATVWTAAFHYCLVSAAGGRGGWRLPRYSELTSLIGSTAASVGGVLPAGHPFQNIDVQAYYWSSTVSVTHPTTAAYSKALLLHSSNVDSMSNPHPFLCVRGAGEAGAS
jgi:hypothetical protein